MKCLASALVLAAAAIALTPGDAAAQAYQSGTPHFGTIEVGGGAVWTGGYDAGSGSATESANSTTGASPVTLFTSSARVASVTGVQANAAVYLGSRVSAEAIFQFSRPSLRVRLGDDFESAADKVAIGGLSSYVFGGSLVYHVRSGRIVPFLLGGGGYLRQLDEDNAAVLSGNEVHAGGGLKMWFGSGGSGLGLRVEAQVSARSKSAGFEEKRRVLPVLGAGLTYRF